MSAAPCRILIVEDDPAIASTITYALQREGFATQHCTLLQDAWQRLAGSSPPAYAAVVLDIGLPDGNGLDLCRQMRHMHYMHQMHQTHHMPALATLPVLILSARSDEFDRVLGLDMGADDYLPKPFSPRELLARLRALLRRTGAAIPPAPPLHHAQPLPPMPAPPPPAVPAGAVGVAGVAGVAPGTAPVPATAAPGTAVPDHGASWPAIGTVHPATPAATTSNGAPTATAHGLLSGGQGNTQHSQQHSQQHNQQHGWQHDMAGQRIYLHGQALELTRMEYGLLACLLTHAGRILERGWLFEQVWGEQATSADRTVDTHIKTLRAKLRTITPHTEHIITHRGMGYSLNKTVS